jgi:hypothetical protein
MLAIKKTFEVRGKRLLALLALVILAGSGRGLQAQGISSFECGIPGADPACEGWVTSAGVPSINFTFQFACAGLPSDGVRYCQLPGSGGTATPAFAGVGNPSAYPYSSGVTEISRTFVAQFADLEIDYNWSAPIGAPSFFEILIVDPGTNAVLDVFVQGDAAVTNLSAPGCDATFGSPSPNGTGLQTATATVPPAFVGQMIKVVVVSGESAPILIGPISFVNIDNLRYGPLAPLYPGNGADCELEVSINGLPQTGFSDIGQNDLSTGDTFTLRMSSPGTALDNQGFALVYTLFNSATPPTAIPLLGAGNPADVWIDPMNAVVVLDSLSPPTTALVPQLFPGGGYVYGPFLTPVGLSGNSAMLQLFASAPGYNPVNIGVAAAQELRFL